MEGGSEITIIANDNPHDIAAFGGGLEGAKYTTRETASWVPSVLNADGVINWNKQTADARGRETVQNDGYALNGVSIHRDSVVGAQYRLSATPAWQVIPGASEEYAQELQQQAEILFSLSANSNDCWLDAARINTFTSMVRLAVACFAMTGEVCASAEWIRERARPFKTAVQLFSPDRLCNPNGQADTEFLRRGIGIDSYGKPVSYSVRNGDQFATYGQKGAYTWTTFAPRTPWGRKQMIHIIEQLLVGQNRGVADMVSVLKQMKMTKQFQDITLQNAVINASYAAAIESELPDQVLAQAMGTPGAASSPFDGYQDFMGGYLKLLENYIANGTNLKMDGAKIPHLFPGSKLNMKPVGTPGGVGTSYEASLLRHTAAGLGCSYEELSRDFSKVSYSSARTSIASTEKFIRSRKKHVADRFAEETYALWFEEMWQSGNLPLPPGQDRTLFYQPLMKEAFTRSIWIGSGAGQIDELKETQAAILKVQSGLSTYEKEIANLGGDWREMFAQAIREQRMIEKNGLNFLLSAKRPLGAQPPPQDAASEGS